MILKSFTFVVVSEELTPNRIWEAGSNNYLRTESDADKAKIRM